MSPIRGLYAITAEYPDLGRTHADVAAAALEGGARVVQFRDKRLTGDELRAAAGAVQALCAEYGAAFVVNDHVDVAMALRADGLHVGQDDLEALTEWRPTWGAFLGVTAWTAQLAWDARARGADYVGAGPVRPTTSKALARGPIGVEGIRAVCSAGLPVAAIGGIGPADVAEVRAAGAAAICAMSAIGRAVNPARAAREISLLAEA